MLEEAGCCWWVVGVGEWFWYRVGECGCGFSLVSDGEFVVGGGDGGGDESAGWDAFGYGVVAVGDLDGVFCGDMAEEGDSSVAEGDGQFVGGVEVVGYRYGGWPAELVAVLVDVFGWVSGSMDGRVEDGSFGVEPFAGAF